MARSIRGTGTLGALSLGLATAVLGAGCGGGGGGSGGGTSASTSGVLTAPNGQVAMAPPTSLDRVKEFFVGGTAHAAVTGLTPVAGATVRLIRINDSGAEIAQLGTTTSLAGGVFTFPGIAPALDQAVIVSGTAGATMRALVGNGPVELNPLSEFVVQQTLAAIAATTTATLAGFTLEERAAINALIQVLEIDFSAASSIAEALTQVDSTAGTAIQALVADAAEPGTSSSRLGGDFNVVDFTGLALQNGIGARNARRSAAFDGTSGFSIPAATASSWTINGGALGSASPALGARAGSYSVLGSGAAALSNGGVLTGQLSSGNDVLVLETSAVDAELGLLVALERGSGLSAATLSGEYHMIGLETFGFRAGSTQSHAGVASFSGTASFNGAGSVVVTTDESSATMAVSTTGTIDTDTGTVGPDTLAYTIGSTGAFEIAASAPTVPAVHRGFVSADGSFAVTTRELDDGATANQEDFGRGIMFFVKKGTGLSVATANGTYRVILLKLEFDSVDDTVAFRQEVGTFTFDGAGTSLALSGTTRNLTLDIATGDVSTTEDTEDDSDSYTISSNGSLSSNVGFGLPGAISSDGRIVVLPNRFSGEGIFIAVKQQ